ncbi:MAG: energy-coupling factor transporter transmembrane protein EcfT [Candidatus Riflebacteria bacterium]|nr:energy-coupling factor transporter transmembrane protein EcfT [Candidatus Riflebacteria bacterium]
MSFFASQLVIGQYIPGASIVHRLNPLLKLLVTLALMVGIFAFPSWRHYVAFAALWLMFYLASRLPLVFFLKGLRPLLFLIGMTLVLHLFLTPGGKVLVKLGPLSITEQGATQGLYFTVRLILLVSFTSLLTLTTSTMELTFAIEKVTSPFKRVGFPSEEFAMMLTIALRFIPVLFLELDKIIKAQRCRGVDFMAGTLRSRGQAYLAILVPLFLNTFSRAMELATAMEVRCYETGVKRGSLREHPFRRDDLLACVVCTSVAAVLIFIR